RAAGRGLQPHEHPTARAARGRPGRPGLRHDHLGRRSARPPARREAPLLMRGFPARWIQLPAPGLRYTALVTGFEGLPGAELVLEGLSDPAAGRGSVPA